LGKVGAAKANQVVDFREQIGIYVLYDKDLKTVYVGQAGSGNARLFERLKNHTNDHLRDRWSYFSWFGFREVTQKNRLSEKQEPNSEKKVSYNDALGQIEGVLIEVLEPPLNRQSASWDAKEYVQYIESSDTTLDDIYREIQELKNKADNI
jgi:hypothetical protein